MSDKQWPLLFWVFTIASCIVALSVSVFLIVGVIALIQFLF